MFRGTQRTMKNFSDFMEDAPVNNVSSGNISGANEDPPVNKKKKKNIYLGLGSRVQWLRNVKKNGK